MSRTEYAVQASSRSTGRSGRWVNCPPSFLRLDVAQEYAAERTARNPRVAYRVVSRTVTPWVEVEEVER